MATKKEDTAPEVQELPDQDRSALPVGISDIRVKIPGHHRKIGKGPRTLHQRTPHKGAP